MNVACFTFALAVCAHRPGRELCLLGCSVAVHPQSLLFSLLDGESAMGPVILLQCSSILSAFKKVLCSLKLPLQCPPGSLV